MFDGISSRFLNTRITLYLGQHCKFAVFEKRGVIVWALRTTAETRVLDSNRWVICLPACYTSIGVLARPGYRSQI